MLQRVGKFFQCTELFQGRSIVACAAPVLLYCLLYGCIFFRSFSQNDRRAEDENSVNKKSGEIQRSNVT